MGYLCILVLACFFALSTTCQAHHAVYLIRVNKEAKPCDFPNVTAWYRSFLTDPENLIYVYETVFGGFAAWLSSSEVSDLNKRPEVLRIFPDGSRSLQWIRMDSISQAIDREEARARLHLDDGYGNHYGLISDGSSTTPIAPTGEIFFKDDVLPWM